MIPEMAACIDILRRLYTGIVVPQDEVRGRRTDWFVCPSGDRLDFVPKVRRF